MTWTIELDPATEKELRQIGHQDAKRVLKFLFERLAQLDDPRSVGEALKGATLGALWKYRVGDNRVIAEIRDEVLLILVVRIGKRREVYRR